MLGPLTPSTPASGLAIAFPDFWHEVHLDYDVIVNAIAASDPEAAGQAMHVHLERLRKSYEAIDRLTGSGS